MFFYINPFDEIEKYDPLYDSSRNLILIDRAAGFWDIAYSLPDKNAHHLCISLEYAQMLLDKSDQASITRAADIINAVISFQDTNPTHKTYGLFPVFAESIIYGNDEISSAMFICINLLQILEYHSDKLSQDMVLLIHQTCNNLASYFSLNKNDICYRCSSFALVEAYVMRKCGLFFDSPEFIHYSNSLFNTYYSGTIYNENYWEYGSFYECYVISEILSMMQKGADKLAFSTAIDSLYDLIWKNISENYHAELDVYTGPQANISKPMPIDQFRLFIQCAVGKNVHKPPCTPILSKCPHKYVFHFYAKNAKKNLQSLVSRGSNYRFSYISRIATNYIRPNYTLGSFNHEYFWYGNIPVIGYFGTKNDLHNVTLKVVNQGHDFASAKINCVQYKNTILGHILFVTNRGDRHLSIDEIKEPFTTNDLRIRLSANGDTSLIKYSKKKNTFFLTYNNIQLTFSVPYVKFGQLPIRFSVSKTKNRICFDVCLVKSTKKVFIDFNNIQEAICQFVLKLCDYHSDIPSTANKSDDRSLVSCLTADNCELTVNSLSAPNYYEYSDVFDKQYINGTTLPEFTYLIQKNTEQYNFITFSDIDLNTAISSKKELEDAYSKINSCKFDELSSYIPNFFEILNDYEFPLVTFKRHAVELIRCIYKKRTEEQYKKNEQNQVEYIINNNYFDIYKKISLSSDTDSIRQIVEKAYMLLSQSYEPSHKDIVSEVLFFIEKNYGNPTLSLKEVSEAFGVSESYISRIVRKKTHMPYIKHLRSIRAEKSKKLLLSGIPIEKVAEQCGYLSVSGYKKAFSDYTGMSVSAWVRREM